VDDTFDFEDCMAVLLEMQALCDDEYDSELKRVGTWMLPGDPDVQDLSAPHKSELERLANIISRFALKQTMVCTMRNVYEEVTLTLFYILRVS
jgi:hypothetical protein